MDEIKEKKKKSGFDLVLKDKKNRVEKKNTDVKTLESLNFD